jgi:hypothetical protein
LISPVEYDFPAIRNGFKEKKSLETIVADAESFTLSKLPPVID